MCRGLAPNAELASIPNHDVHTRLVSLVTNGGNSNPVLTWIGGIVEASLNHTRIFKLSVQIIHDKSTTVLFKNRVGAEYQHNHDCCNTLCNLL